MWNTLNTDESLDAFLQRVAYFHDSCLKSFSFVSGAYVDSHLAMHSVNDKRTLSMVFQSQFEDIAGFELEFLGLKSLNYIPTDPMFICEIESANMYFKDGLIYFEHDSCLISDRTGQTVLNSVCAEGCRWRIIPE